MENHPVKLLLAEENENALLADGFDDALIGIARRCSQPTLAVYDIDDCITVARRSRYDARRSV